MILAAPRDDPELVVLLEEEGADPSGSSDELWLLLPEEEAQEPPPASARRPAVPPPPAGSLGTVAHLAWRNLTHDRLRLLTAVLGVVFATVLMAIQAGLLLGFVDTTTAPVSRAGADLWVMQTGTKNFEMASAMPERRHYQALATPGVAWSSRLIVDWTSWKTSAGQSEQVCLVGVDPERPVGLPRGVAAGDPGGIWRARGVMVDLLDRERLGGGRPLGLGDEPEVRGHRARVVGFTRDVRSFTTTPYVFTSLRFARDFAGTLPHPAEEVKYLALGLSRGADLEAVRRRLLDRLDDVEVLTAAEFKRRTASYWLLNTGIGAMSILAAFLGLLVGGAIVGQTIYGQTLERLPEYGTFKALGGTNRELAGVVLCQAAVTCALGFFLGAGLALAAASWVNEGRLLLLLPPWGLACLAAVTGATCALASLSSVARVVRLEPAEVFRR